MDMYNPKCGQGYCIERCFELFFLEYNYIYIAPFFNKSYTYEIDISPNFHPGDLVISTPQNKRQTTRAGCGFFVVCQVLSFQLSGCYSWVVSGVNLETLAP